MQANGKPFPLPDGRRVTVRHLRPADADLLLNLYAELSPEARRQRFFHGHRVTAEECSALAAIEQDGGVVLVALADDGAVVAEARCVRARAPASSGDAEPMAGFAITIRDDYQRLGLGTLLLDESVAAAASAGIVTLVAEVLGDNVGMRRLLATRHFSIADRDGISIVQAVFRVDGRVPDWGDDKARPRVLVEAHGWYGSVHERHLRDAGYSVMVCAGPSRGGWCDLLATGSCRLADEADAIICSIRDEADERVLASHQTCSPDTPLFVAAGPDDPPPADGVAVVKRSGTAEELLDALDRHGVPRPR